MSIHRIHSARTIDAMKPAARRLNDGDGLHIRQASNRKKYWYLDYSFKGKRRSIALGQYPIVSLARARDLAIEAKRQVLEGIDPVAARKKDGQGHDARSEAQSFKAVAETWLNIQRKGWSDGHAAKEYVRLHAHVYPVLGMRPIRTVETRHVAGIVETLGNDGKVETAERVLSLCRRVCDFAVSKGYLGTNPCSHIKQILPSAARKHRAAVTTPFQLAPVLRSIGEFRGSFVVHCALQLTVMTFLRSSEMRGAKWDEFDLDHQMWLVPGMRMKGTKERKLNGGPHYVPLSRQAVALLRKLRQLTGPTGYVFAGQGTKNPFISDNAVNKALRSVGISTSEKQTAHGFRATARTVLVEELGFTDDLVELQLDHVVRGPNGRAYNRAKFHEQRAVMLQRWADYLDWLRAQTPSTVMSTWRLKAPRELRAPGAADWPDDTEPTTHSLPAFARWPSTASDHALSVHGQGLRGGQAHG